DYLLRGYSVKATANRLGISDGTVRIHRHSIYGKLDVKSQTELFALVVEALKLVDPADNDDPLLRLEQPASSF
ncbi:MAG: helix-turn-helix transcriptional regulator, partial [Gammaproteobacteria bacterium]|nr:helix-turn-helix transcriptional regulator [Gammaproteobacteria bacterium]